MTAAASLEDRDLRQPPRCPVCDGFATSTVVRTADGITQGNYLCAGRHAWLSKWVTV